MEDSGSDTGDDCDAYPEMDKTTFRLSLLRAVEQAKEGKPVIRNANAWLKAAFEKNGAPLVTARDIEAQVRGGEGAEPSRLDSPQADQTAPAARRRRTKSSSSIWPRTRPNAGKSTVWPRRRWRTMQAVLDQVGPDKHQAILVQARIEAGADRVGGSCERPG